MSNNVDKPLNIFILTGEPSGDLLGARLMQGLKRASVRPLQFRGIGGDKMLAEGLNPLFPQKDLAVFGLAELLPKLFKLLRRLRQTVETIIAEKPDIVITIDSPDFSFRVGERLKKIKPDVKIIHYVAPTVWAWRPKRAAKVAKFLNHVLALFPFEPPYFTKEGLACSFVGHPIIENGIEQASPIAFRHSHAFTENDLLLTVLPGSRTSEVTRLLPIYKETIALLMQRFPGLKLVMPTVPHVAAHVKAEVAAWPWPVLILENDAEKYAAFRASQAGLCASGTVTLEGALAGMPMVVAYKLSALTVFLYKRLFTIKHFSPVNILLGREAIPERLQHLCTPENLAAELAPLLEADQTQRRDLALIGPMLTPEGGMPSDVAANVVMEYLPK